METKLIKDRLFLRKVVDSYVLHRIKDGILTIEGDSQYTIGGIEPFYKLSLKNCQAIELGYDLDDSVDYFKKGKTYIQQDGVIILAGENATDGIVIKDPLKSRGVGHYSNEWNPKAFCEYSIELLEILGDKKFTYNQMVSAITESSISHRLPSLIIQDLQQTEWDVVIVTKPFVSVSLIIVDFSEDTPVDVLNVKKEVVEEGYALDEDGCLILRKI